MNDEQHSAFPEPLRGLGKLRSVGPLTGIALHMKDMLI